MANKYPLVINTVTNRITELLTADDLELGFSNIANVGNINANFFAGNGSQLTGVIAVSAGTVTTAAQPNITSTGTLTSLDVSGLSNIANVQLKIYEETVLASVNTSTAISPDVSTGSIFRYTANNNFTFNGLTNAVAGTSATIIITQDATGSRTLTSTMKFAGAAKTMSTDANAVDIISVFYDGTTYYAVLSKGYA